MFDSFEAAIANYASKPPLAAFDPDALDAYVRHGFRADGDHVRLKCEPEHEARTFEQGGRHAHVGRARRRSPSRSSSSPGTSTRIEPSAIAGLVAEALPRRAFPARRPRSTTSARSPHPGAIADLIAHGVERRTAPTDGPSPR